MAEKDLEEMREAVEAIREKMAAAAREAGRDPAEVQLCAACKTRTADTVAASAALAPTKNGQAGFHPALPAPIDTVIPGCKGWSNPRLQNRWPPPGPL